MNIYFVQDDNSRKVLEKHNFKNVVVCGDTRFDTVMHNAANLKDFPLVEKFKHGKTTIIGGSTWKDDERLLSELIKKRKGHMKYIIAPHEVSEKRIAALLDVIILPAVRYSEANEQNVEAADVLVIDNIGMLSQLYRYGDVAFIGGGFGKGIHNILEPAAFGLPVIFGPNYEKFNEAHELMNLSAAFSVDKFRSMNNKLTDLLFNKESIVSVKKRIIEYMNSKLGATQVVVSGLEKLI